MNLDRFRLWVWFGAYVIFVGGDLVTTVLGMHTAGIFESNPLYFDIFESQNEIGIILMKHAIFSGFLIIENAFGRLFNKRLTTVIPLALLIYGTWIMVNNIIVLMSNGVDLLAIIVPVLIIMIVAFEMLDWKSKTEMSEIE